MPAGEIRRAIERLNVVGSVLYVAAHPDDENTRLISWLVGHKGLQAAYLSMTRGGGGQNLIGKEQAELLGVVRTGELLEARKIDGGAQYFSRMRDFGYSKSAPETIRVWGHEAALSDVVQVIRIVRPDVVIARFATKGRNHGHHTASAILAGEAFRAAADPQRFKNLGLNSWQADRLLHNRSHWRMKPSTDKSGFLKLDVGTFDPLIGQSYGEVSAVSRSMHKSQGFGTSPSIGPQMEYFSPLAGTSLKPGDDVFKGLNLTWSRFSKTAGLTKAIAQAAQAFDPAAPHKVLPKLTEIRSRLLKVSNGHWREIKLRELDRIIVSCAGLWLTARSKKAVVSPGTQLPVELTAVNRSKAKVRLRSTTVGSQSVGGTVLKEHRVWVKRVDLQIAKESKVSGPHWLRQTPTSANYLIAEVKNRVIADDKPVLSVVFNLEIEGATLRVSRPIEHAWTDAVAGERVHPVEVLPPVTATPDRPVLMVPVGGRATARIFLRSDTARSGAVELQLPKGLTLTSNRLSFALSAAKPEQVVEVTVSAEDRAQAGALAASIRLDDQVWRSALNTIDYPHLPRRRVLRTSELRIVPVVLDRGGINRIGYLSGSGDAVADSLRSVGYSVEQIDVNTVVSAKLGRFQAVVMGIRAYNKHPRLLALHGQLMAYVAQGGKLIVQYNTNNHFNPLNGPMGPKPFHISRLRVTDETATMTALDPQHAALTKPNRLGPADFAGWVQERGLYFADTWDPFYTPVFSASDPGERPVKGGLLVARHEKGVFVYTGISFFRQLPAGVAGAYRLFANMLAL